MMMRSQGTIEKAKALFVQRFKREPAFGSESAALSGESPESMRARADNALAPQERYRRLAGEVEARNTQARQGMTDEQQRTYLESIRRTRFKTLIMTAHIDKAVEEIERRREAAGRGVEYKAFEMYFMQGMDYAEIAEELDTGKNTPRRWVTGIINELSVLLWGIDEERVK